MILMWCPGLGVISGHGSCPQVYMPLIWHARKSKSSVLMLRQKYLEEVEGFLAAVRKTCRELHLDYELYNTSDPLDVALSTYLAARSAGIR